ncbi:MAG: DUF3450 domain-containing protein [Candidatus Eutrophobiaceae bacterium]
MKLKCAILCMVLICGKASADELETIQGQGSLKVDAAQQSQEKIDKIVAGAQERLIEYRSLMKQIEGLEAYNTQLSAQIQRQEDLLRRFDESIAQVAQIERQLSPLLVKMYASLEKFVELDLPFHGTERRERLAYLRDSMEAADIDVAEKFRQIIEAYQIENEYGRKLDTWQDIVNFGGQKREVDVLRVGRIAMVCQTRDTKLTAWWNQANEKWELLDPLVYRNDVRRGLKMAKKQESIDITVVPIPVPELEDVETSTE